MRLSFIIPVYNGRGTIIPCIESIRAQMQGDDYEIIIVDDCSTDDTRETITGYAKSCQQVKLFCQSRNRRQGAARNRGLKVAQGEYITFVDADDIVLDGVVPALKIAEQGKVDLVYCSCYHENTTTEVVLKEIDMPEEVVLSGVDFCEKYQQEGVFWYPWGILYRREWLQALNYPFIEDRQHEDRDWLAYVMSHAGTIANCKLPMYRYVCNPHSTCRAPRYSTIFDHVASGIRHIDLAKQLRADCPKLSATLYAFGMEEIHHSVRLRNLTKYPWVENRCLYDENHLMPLMKDLKRVCKDNKVHSEVKIVAYWPLLTKIMVLIASPLAHLVRIVKH